jgi:signal transduction histidine kinase
VAISARRLIGVQVDRAAPRPGARVGAAGAALCLGAAAVAASGAPSNAAVGRALLELLIVGVPIVAGLYALRAELSPAFAVALLVIGFSWSLTALSESSLSVPYTLGRLATWLVFPGVVYLLLAFPDGHVASGLDRALFGFVLVLSLVLFYGTAPLVVAFPPHTPWATCTTDCPANAVALVSRPPTWLSTLVLVREWMVMLLWLGLFVSMLRRWRAASPMRRTVMAPVFMSATALGICHIAFHATRELGAPASTVEDLGSAWTLGIVVVCSAIFFALIWRRTLLAGALRGLGAALQASDAPLAVRDALATALGDPTLQLLIRDGQSGAWRDAGGNSAAVPVASDARRAVTAIGDHQIEPTVILVHDIALRDDPELLDDIAGMVLASLRHEQLMGNLTAAMSDLEESRRRIVEAADVERARIERDLHDGAQAQLVALRVRADLAEELLKTDPAAGIEEIHKLGRYADRALADLRALARGVYPVLLSDLGLVDALRSMAREAVLPVRVNAHGVTRHPIEIESAVYFTCVEATQNAIKHAAGANGVSIALDEAAGLLRFSVQDDGPGLGLDAGDGRGLHNMHDRIAAVGGRLCIEHVDTGGTRIVGEVSATKRAANSTC